MMPWMLACRPPARKIRWPFLGLYAHFCVRQVSQAAVEPLRILFCGSEAFSAASLEALRAESLRNPDLIASIDVVCKSGKPSGRGLRKIRDAPIKDVAGKLGLPLHEIPTFTGWHPPTRDGVSVNLIIAVSFGLLVPPRLLEGAKYGGLNLHPSLLPELRGPAPLQHTILNGLQESGVSLQTLHRTEFDRGVVLAQDHFPLQADVTSNLDVLRWFMSERGANLLISSLRKRVYLSPDTPAADLIQRPESHAPKTTSEDAHVLWESMTANEILRRQTAVGPLWSSWTYKDKDGVERSRRIVWHDLQIIKTDLAPSKTGLPLLVAEDEPTATSDKPGRHIGGIWTCDGTLLSPAQVTIEGRKKGWPGDFTRVVEYLWSLTSVAISDNAPSQEEPGGPMLL